MNGKRQRSCAVSGCTLRISTPRHFFKFPKEHDRWLQWVHACGRLDLVDKGPEYAYRNCRLCHLHFENKWYNVNKIRAHLHPDAVPTIFFGSGGKLRNITPVENKEGNPAAKKIDGNTCTKVTQQVQKKNSNVITLKLPLLIAINQVKTVKPTTSAQKCTNIKKPSADSLKIQKLLLKNQKWKAQNKSLRETIRRLRMKEKKRNTTIKKDNKCS